jgi:hypothetical protein
VGGSGKAGGSSAPKSSNAGAGGTGGERAGASGERAGSGGSAGTAADSCERTDIDAPVSLASMRELGTVARPESIVMRVPGPISWIGGKLVWLFPKSARATSVMGADVAPNQPNAALIPGSDATKLEEDLDPDGAPRRFLTADDKNAANELWPTALLRLAPPANQDTTTGVVFVRRLAPDVGYDVSDVLVGRVARNTTSAHEPLTPLFTGNEPKFSTGAFRGTGYAYLFACGEDASVADKNDAKHFPCKIARVEAADVERHDSYRVYDPASGQWLSDLSAGAPVLFGPPSLLSLSYNNYLGRFLAVYSRWFSNDVIVQSAKQPQGPWREEFAISLPAPPSSVVAFATEQAVLTPASKCATSLIISYLWPTASTNAYPSAGEIKLIEVELK